MKKLIGMLSALMIFVTLLAGCGPQNGKGTQRTGSFATVTDQAGREVKLDKQPERIVSGYQISTHALIALELTDKVVGIESKGKTGTDTFYKKIAPALLEKERVGTKKEINVEATLALNPDLVIIPFSLKDSAQKFEEANIPVLVVEPESQEQFLNMVSLLGNATGKTQRAEELVTYYNNKTKQIEEKLAGVKKLPKVFLSSADPLRAAGSKMFQADLVKLAKGDLVTKDIDSNSWSNISLEQMVQYNPEYLFMANDPTKTLQEMQGDKGWKNIDAVKNGRVYAFPSKLDLWDRPTFTAVLAPFWMANKMHPKLVDEKYLEKEVKEVYKTIFGVAVTPKELGM